MSDINGMWVQKAMNKTDHRRIILDMDSSESPVHGGQEGSAYNGHLGAPVFILYSASISLVTVKECCSGLETSTVPMVGKIFWNRLSRDMKVKKSRDTFVVMLLLQNLRFMNIWRVTVFCMPSGSRKRHTPKGN